MSLSIRPYSVIYQKEIKCYDHSVSISFAFSVGNNYTHTYTSIQEEGNGCSGISIPDILIKEAHPEVILASYTGYYTLNGKNTCSYITGSCVF